MHTRTHMNFCIYMPVHIYIYIYTVISALILPPVNPSAACRLYFCSIHLLRRMYPSAATDTTEMVEFDNPEADRGKMPTTTWTFQCGSVLGWYALLARISSMEPKKEPHGKQVQAG